MVVLLVSRAVARLRAAERRVVPVVRAAPARRVATVPAPAGDAVQRGPAMADEPMAARRAAGATNGARRGR